MRVIAAVPFASVLDTFARAHPLDRAHEANTNDEAEEHIRNAELSLGSWRRVLLDRDDLLRVVLPWHLGEGGERELIPQSGLTVAEAVVRLDAVTRPDAAGGAYARTNPVCARKLAGLAAAPFTPLFLSTRAVPGIDYAGLVVREGLIHLDGLHRALAWERAGRLTAGTRIEAFLAYEEGLAYEAGQGHEASRVHEAGLAYEGGGAYAEGLAHRRDQESGHASTAADVRHRTGQDGDGLDVHAHG
ncbi:DUF6309 family protein [Streptomyces sp. NPDC087525]|uniref:DUF6309 family protein n=1 Tax=Streptomyces sp. NPDC087525 TaxID=3365793 RepID=UPI003819368E